MPFPPHPLAAAKQQLDFAAPEDQASVVALAQALLANEDATDESLAAAAREPDAPLEFRIAAKLVDSRRYLLGLKRPVKLTIVFAMWGEHNRLRPRSPDNPNGEDALRVKLRQLAWATAGTPVDWTVYAVDDGDPNDSGALATEIAAGEPLGDHVQVLSLADALPSARGPLAGLASADDSRKGGAVIHGCARALADGANAVIYTDADVSVHLGQIGLLLRPFLERGARVVLGDRKHADAVLVKQEGRWGIGIKALRHMQRLVGHAIFSRGIRDTQAAFKLYEAGLLRDILAAPTVYDFSFDSDWILAAVARGEKIETVPFAFIDSAAESASIAQGPMTTWETLLLGLVKAVRRHAVPHDEAMACVLDEEIRSARDLELLIDHLPPELEDATDVDLGDPALMSPERMREWIRERKRDA
jgi:hypothetical protein